MKTKVKIFEESKEKIFFFVEKGLQDFSVRKGYIDFTVSKVISYISIFSSISPKGRKNMACQIQKVEKEECKTFMKKYVFQLTEGEK